VYINPFGTFIRFWRLLNSILLIYNATATPFRVAFHTSKTSQFLFVFELFTDSVFVMDIFISLVTPYQRIDGSYEENRRKLAKNYMKKDLTFDLIAAFPTVLLEGNLPLIPSRY
jgi:hypothetical protein